jgi:hypothetical protein
MTARRSPDERALFPGVVFGTRLDRAVAPRVSGKSVVGSAIHAYRHRVGDIIDLTEWKPVGMPRHAVIDLSGPRCSTVQVTSVGSCGWWGMAWFSARGIGDSRIERPVSLGLRSPASRWRWISSASTS